MLRRWLTLGFLVLAVGGCDDGIVGSSTVTGDYVLRRVNGAPLPYVIAGVTPTTELLDGVITLYQGGTYSETGHRRVSVADQVTTQTSSEAGSYSLFGTSVTLRRSDGLRERRGRIDANDMTLVEAGLTLVFSK